MLGVDKGFVRPVPVVVTTVRLVREAVLGIVAEIKKFLRITKINLWSN